VDECKPLPPGEASTSEHRFGPIKIPPKQVFVESTLSVGRGLHSFTFQLNLSRF